MPAGVVFNLQCYNLKMEGRIKMNQIIREDIRELQDFYSSTKENIMKRLKEFKQLWNSYNDDEIFGEMAFCLLTPQSKAKVCWKAILKLKEKALLLNGTAEEIQEELTGVRFKEKKSYYIILARDFFTINDKIVIKSVINEFHDIYKLREWLVANIKGYGYKEAGHFLRNIGFGDHITILDRHILKNLKRFNVIEEIPESISKSKYMEIEKKMKDFCDEINIPLSHMDILLWSKETGEIFK